MHRFRSTVVGFVMLVVIWVGGGADAQTKEQQQPRRPGVQPGQPGGPLVPTGIEDKLKLTPEQKDKVAKIEKEFADKAKENEIKLRELMQKARADKDRAALKQIQEKAEEAGKVRKAYEAKVLEVLTAEQKKTFEQQATGAARRRAVPASAGASQLLPPALQERLNLTAQQKEKLNQLQKEFESKAIQVLTEEQRKQYEEFLKRRTRQPDSPRPRSSTPRLDGSDGARPRPLARLVEVFASSSIV
jgi:Spy/CpxP family protein refolding chaperone